MALDMAQYTHVIFDFGGVITASPFEAFNRLEAERGLPRDFVRGVNARNPDANAWALFERAEIDARLAPSRRGDGPAVVIFAWYVRLSAWASA